MYKLIACDVDGTLLDKSMKATNANKKAIQAAQQKGIIFTLCSGRSHKNLITISDEFGIQKANNYIIGFNGSLVYDLSSDKLLRNETLDMTTAIDIVHLFKEIAQNIDIVIYADADNLIFEEGAEYAPEYLKIAKINSHTTKSIAEEIKKLTRVSKIIFFGENSDLLAFEGRLKSAAKEKASVFFSAEYLLEASPATASKASGVQWLCKAHNIHPSEVIAIGDNHNDLSMIEFAGLGVAVENAVLQAKKIANYITKNNCSNDAVAEVINKFVLSQS